MDDLNLNTELLEESNGSVKKEMDFLQIENLSTHPMQLSSSYGDNSSYGENSSFPLVEVNDNINNRLPLDLSTLRDLNNLCKLEMVKTEIPYLVKYKIQEGKHVKIWQCKTCSKEFGHQYTLMRHLPTHTDERKFQCNTCGKAFRQMSTLSQHRAIHSHERPYVCEVCQKTFNRVSTLISHRKTHTGIKPHQCHLCNKAFHQKGNLRNHIFTHTNERPYKCDDCGKGFNQMSNLMCHKLKSHQRIDKPKHACQICRRSFTKRIALRNHEQYEHRGVTNVVDSYLTDEPKYVANPVNTNKSYFQFLINNSRITNAIFVEPIKTKAMQLAIESKQIPFALLRPLNGIPVLVRVLSAGNDKQMLVPASAEDLKKHGQISVTPKTSVPNVPDEGEKENLVGSTVQIKIPVVATVIQQSGEGGHLSMSVVSPGPSDDAIKPSNPESVDSYVFTATSNENNVSSEDSRINKENMKHNSSTQGAVALTLNNAVVTNVNLKEDCFLIE